MGVREPSELLFDPSDGPSKIRNQTAAGAGWLTQALWSGRPRKVYLQLVNAGGNLIACKVSTTSDGSSFVMTIPAGSGLEFTPEPTRVYYVYASAAGTFEALVTEE